MPELVVCGAILVTAGCIMGCVGFGFALVASPCLMLILPPGTVVPLIILLSSPNLLLVVFQARRHIRPRLVASLALGGILGLPAGIAALRLLDPTLLKLFVSAIVVLVALALLSGWRRPVKNLTRALFPVGLLSGFLGGSTAMGGPPAVLFLANQETPKEVFRANLVCYFLALNLVACLMFFAQGLLTRAIAGRALLFYPFVLAGTCLGIRISQHVPEKLFRTIVIGAVAALGITLLIVNLLAYRAFP